MHADVFARREGLIALCRRYDVARLEIFGSAARGIDFDHGASDIDFLVNFRPGGRMPALDQFFGLAEDLETLLGRHVDLVETGAISNPFLKAEIETARELVYAE